MLPQEMGAAEITVGLKKKANVSKTRNHIVLFILANSLRTLTLPYLTLLYEACETRADFGFPA